MINRKNDDKTNLNSTKGLNIFAEKLDLNRLREAVVLSEILGKPVSRRKNRGRR